MKQIITFISMSAKNPKLTDKSVLLLDGAPAFRGYSPDTYSNRVYSLNRGTVELLERIGAWQTIVGIRHRPVQRMQVWDARSDAQITFGGGGAAGAAHSEIACIVENDVLVHAVLEQLRNHCADQEVHVQNGSRIEAVQLPASAAPNDSGRVTLTTGESFSCDLLVSVVLFLAIYSSDEHCKNVRVRLQKYDVCGGGVHFVVHILNIAA